MHGTRSPNPTARNAGLRRILLGCGLGAALVYVVTDIAASARYPGYRFADQAVSELFAIGAPTGSLVVPLFSLASLLLLGFAGGIWLSAGGRPAVRLLALLFGASALDALLLWIFFPMHMRGEPTSFTDTMHLILGANPFVWGAILGGALGFRGWFRLISLAALAILLVPAIFAFHFAPALVAGEATPGLGLAERAAQYGYQLWQVALALLLLRNPAGRAG